MSLDLGCFSAAWRLYEKLNADSRRDAKSQRECLKNKSPACTGL